MSDRLVIVRALTDALSRPRPTSTKIPRFYLEESWAKGGLVEVKIETVARVSKFS